MTARIATTDGRLRIHRTGVARWFGSSLDVPLTHVESASVADLDEVKRLNKGIRLTGIQIPGLRTSGIYRHGEGLTWWDVGRANKAIVITFRDERLTRAVVEVNEPAAVIQVLDQALEDAALAAEPIVGSTDTG